jgi:dihydroorotate dehydrogenase (fumarate)
VEKGVLDPYGSMAVRHQRREGENVMTDLSTTYLGLPLRNPLVCSSSPLCMSLDDLGRMEEMGAGAVVLHSLFEEQIERESGDQDLYLDRDAEARSYVPDLSDYNLGPDGYLEHIREARAILRIPVIASLNGSTRGGWVKFARLIEESGADALELNVYEIPTDAARSGAQVEQDVVDLVRDVTSGLRIPVAVKLGPYYSALGHLAKRLEGAGARGLALFNRFYQHDFDLDTMEPLPKLHLSTSDELPLRLHWLAILYGHVGLDLAATGGVHSFEDIVKVLLAGGRVAMMTSALLKNGIIHLRHVLSDLSFWLEDHKYESMAQMRGTMSLRAVANLAAFERANYMRTLRSLPRPQRFR